METLVAVGAYAASGAGAAVSFYSSLPFVAKTATVAVGSTLVTPVVIPAVVGALGFGSGGIAAGSTAATMMSWGQGVTPYLVSVCQSIGATGAVAGGTQVATGSLVTAASFAGKALGLF